MDDFRACGFKLAAKLIMLRLRGGKVGRMKKSQLLPAVLRSAVIPSCGAWRTHQHPLQAAHHGVAVEVH